MWKLHIFLDKSFKIFNLSREHPKDKTDEVLERFLGLLPRSFLSRYLNSARTPSVPVIQRTHFTNSKSFFNLAHYLLVCSLQESSS